MQDSLTEMDLSFKGNLLCFVCSNIVEDPSSKSLQLFPTAPEEGPPLLNTILSEVLMSEISQDLSHSSVVCNSCFGICTEYQELAVRMNEIRNEVINNYNSTVTKINAITEQQSLLVENENLGAISEEQQHIISIEDQLVQIAENDQNEIVHIIQHATPQSLIKVLKANEYSHSQQEESLIEEQYFDSNEIEIVTDETAEYIYENVIETITTEDLQEDISYENETGETETADHQQDDEMIIKTELDDDSDGNKNKDEEHNPTFTKNGELFFCAMCPSSLLSYNSKTIVIHVKSEHNIKILICEECDMEFRRKHDLNTHLKQHTNENNTIFKCDICDNIFANFRALRLHKKNHTSTSKDWSCEHCNKKYSSKNLLDEHLNMHTGDRPYKCSNCPKDFASKYTLSAHMKTHLDRQRQYECTHCKKGFYSQQNLIQHEKIHSGIKDYVCADCGKTFISQHNLDVHKIVHSGYKPFICRTCGKSFARRAEIRDHERTHTGERPFSCDLCTASFAQRSNLQSHKRATHFNDKRHKCDTCNRSFKRRRLLDYHIKASHTGERPYKCNVCSSTFVYPEHYKKHLKIHTGLKPYSCEVCGKTFNSRDNRNAHRFIHSDKKPYECMKCGQGFMRKPLLYTHMQQKGHLNDTIVVNQPRITKELLEFEMTEDSIDDVDIDDKSQIGITISQSDQDDDLIEDYYIEEHIEEEDEEIEESHIEEEQLIVDELNGISEDQIVMSGDGNFLEDNGPVQIVRVHLNDESGDDNIAWVNLVSNAVSQ